MSIEEDIAELRRQVAELQGRLVLTEGRTDDAVQQAEEAAGVAVIAAQIAEAQAESATDAATVAVQAEGQAEAAAIATAVTQLEIEETSHAEEERSDTTEVDLHDDGPGDEEADEESSVPETNVEPERIEVEPGPAKHERTDKPGYTGWSRRRSTASRA